MSKNKNQGTSQNVIYGDERVFIDGKPREVMGVRRRFFPMVGSFGPAFLNEYESSGEAVVQCLRTDLGVLQSTNGGNRWDPQGNAYDQIHTIDLVKGDPNYDQAMELVRSKAS